MGTYDPDDGAIELFADGGRLLARVAHTEDVIGVLHYQGDNLYWIAPEVGVKFLGSGVKAGWGMSYAGGLMYDAKRRVQ
jgi:hypothetical protein